jgi:HSP20 family protein
MEKAMEKTKEKEQKEGTVTIRRPGPAVSPVSRLAHLDRMEREMGRMFDDFFVRPWGRPWLTFGRPWGARMLEEPEVRIPAIEVFEEKDDVVVKAELPGMKKEEVEVNLYDNLLTIKGERKEEEEIKKKGYYYSERTYGAFERSIEIPREVLTEKARASFKDGVLEVRFPKTEEAKRKEIKVKVE